MVALGLLVIWMLLEIIFRPDFTGGMKIAWIFVALLFAPVAVPIWFLWVRRKATHARSGTRVVSDLQRSGDARFSA